MKRIIPLLMVISLLISGLSSCKSEPVTVPTCDELIAAYEAAGYHVFHQTESNPENCNCSVKVWADDENDYVFFCFFDSAENAENYDSTREYNVLIYLFSVIYGDPTWIHTETYGNIEYEYSSSALLKPFRDLIQ